MTFVPHTPDKPDKPSAQSTPTAPVTSRAPSTPSVDIGENRPPIDDEKTYCAVHTTVETALRCNRCGRYMCTKCAVSTPVGYRCKECVNQQQGGFFKATALDQLKGAAATFLVAVPVSFIVPRLFLLGVLLLSLPAGALIGEAAFRAMGRRRARYMRYIAVALILVATFIAFSPNLQSVLDAITVVNRLNNSARVGARDAAGGAVTDLILGYLVPFGGYALMACFSAYVRLK